LKEKAKDHSLTLPAGFNSKEEYVRDIFAKIAYRYDFLNTALSFNRDKYWRKFAVSRCGIKPGGKGLDVCCGTGMLTIELARAAQCRGEIIGLDFSEEMLAGAKRNITKSTCGEIISLQKGNAMSLPFPDNYFDCAVIGFALRNVADISITIGEMARVVRPGGRVVSLELSKPGAPVFKQAYYLYFNKLVPLLGKMGIGMDGPYSYLPNSLRYFLHQSEIKKIFDDLGLMRDICYHELTGGIVSVHEGTVN